MGWLTEDCGAAPQSGQPPNTGPYRLSKSSRSSSAHPASTTRVIGAQDVTPVTPPTQTQTDNPTKAVPHHPKPKVKVKVVYRDLPKPKVQPKPKPAPKTVPGDLIGSRLDVAEDELDQKHIGYREVAGGMFGIVVRADWKVCETRPGTDAPVHGQVALVVGHFDCSNG